MTLSFTSSVEMLFGCGGKHSAAKLFRTYAPVLSQLEDKTEKHFALISVGCVVNITQL